MLLVHWSLSRGRLFRDRVRVDERSVNTSILLLASWSDGGLGSRVVLILFRRSHCSQFLCTYLPFHPVPALGDDATSRDSRLR